MKPLTGACRYAVPLAGDFPASQMLDSVPGVSEERRKRLVEVLDVDESWRMHTVSDGQRRRVQIACGLLRPAHVLLLDEVTVRRPCSCSRATYLFHSYACNCSHEQSDQDRCMALPVPAYSQHQSFGRLGR